MKIKHLSTVLILLMLGAGCSVYPGYYSNTDQDAEFTSYRTFAWLPDQDTTEALNSQIIRTYFNHCLGEMGMTVHMDGPDVLLELLVEGETQETPGHAGRRPYAGGRFYFQDPFYHPFPGYDYRRSHDYSCRYTTRNAEYGKGTITLNMIDRKRNKLLWTGAAKSILYGPNLLSEDLHQTVHAILKKYPGKSFAAEGNDHARKREVKELK